MKNAIIERKKYAIMKMFELCRFSFKLGKRNEDLKWEKRYITSFTKLRSNG